MEQGHLDLETIKEGRTIYTAWPTLARNRSPSELQGGEAPVQYLAVLGSDADRVDQRP